MTITVGFAGLGSMGVGQARGFAGLDAEVVAGADPSPAVREGFADEFGASVYEDVGSMIAGEELDALNVTTPHTLHHEHVRAALEAGLHVHVEKPMVTDVGAATDLVDLADERDLVLQVGYQRHHDPRYREVKRFVDSGRLGTIHAASCYLEQAWRHVAVDSWREEPSLSGGGQLYDSGSHLLDALLWVLEAEPRRVAAVMDDRGMDVDVNSALAAHLETPDGPVTASVGITGEGTSTPHVGEHLALFGTDGSVTFDRERVTVTVEDEVGYSATFEDVDELATRRRKLGNFVDAVRGETEPAVPGEFGRRVIALTEAAYRAAETGRTVDVAELVSDPKPTV